MRSVLAALLLTLRTSLRARSTLQLEILALRHQLQVLERMMGADETAARSPGD